MICIILLLPLLVGSLTAATPIQVLTSDGRHTTTGITTRAGSGFPYIRREINDLKENHPETWTLFLLGLSAFQQSDQTGPLSYYRISGIHGRPHEKWQDAQGADHPGGAGYCPHNNIMFGVWHRPYVALFEQELFTHVRKIADQYTVDQHRWSMAADAFRIPYWDWALGQKGEEFPDIFTTPLATVIGTDGNQQTIPNPLYQYKFHPTSTTDFESPWTEMNTTLRCPTSHAFDAESQQQMVRTHYMTYRRGVHDGVAKAFSSTTYNAFASELEIHHGTIHFLAGCMDPYSGHFWDTEYSAFDPIFMIVHANVDRLMAMYQAVHPNTWLEPKSSEETGNFWIPNFFNLHADLPMPPFWKDDQNFYTPNDIRNVSVFGYAYPETQYWLYPTTEYWRMAVNESIARYYSPSARGTLTALGDMGSSSTNHLLAGNTFTDWTIKTRTPVLDLPSKFYVVFSFVGIPSPEKSIEVGTWTRQTTGQRDTQARSHHSVNRNRRSYAHNQSDLENTISLTSSLLDQITAGNLKSLSATDVVPYLKKHLDWQVIVEKDSLPGKTQDIAVEVLSTEVHIPDDPAQALEYSSHSTQYPEVTDKH